MCCLCFLCVKYVILVFVDYGEWWDFGFKYVQNNNVNKVVYNIYFFKNLNGKCQYLIVDEFIICIYSYDIYIKEISFKFYCFDKDEEYSI